MNFTREPLVVTVITPKDGYKLVVRSSKGGGQEEFYVDSLEVISFNSYCFYRSLERPKCFMLPISDYEVIEVRETKMALKVPGVDRGIKIGGGRETSMKVAREVKEEEPVAQQLPEIAEEKAEKKREKRRFRKRRRGEEQVEEHEEIRRPSLIPPPNHLISETMRYKGLPLEEENDVISDDESEFPLEEDPLEEEKEEEIHIQVDSNNDEEVPF